jgi:predicted DCC family thiol-disulfide oxidoreductase YuxK
MSRTLPSIHDRPDADVVIYDGHCQFCRRQVERLDWLDGGGRLAFLSLHDPLVAGKYPDLTHERLMEEMVVVDRHGRRHGGASAIRYLSRRLPRMWLLAPFLHIPGLMPLWKWLYRQVAARRYRWNSPGEAAECSDGACRVHRGAPQSARQQSEHAGR